MKKHSLFSVLTLMLLILSLTSHADVIGKDNRVSADSLREDFATKTGLIHYSTGTPGKNPVTITVCTGAMIGAGFILTAAHCAFDKYGNPIRNAMFSPGAKDPYHLPYGSFPIKYSYVPQDYDYDYKSTSMSIASDIAIMAIGQDQSEQDANRLVGTFSYWGRKYPENEVPITTIGYPSDKKNALFYETGCKVIKQYDNLLRLNCDVAKGQSGGPLIRYSAEYDRNYIFGVISGMSANDSYGAYISAERQQIIKAIMNNRYDDTAFAEHWYEIEHPVDEISVIVSNTCQSSEVLAGIRYKNLNGKWVNEGFYHIAAGTDMLIAKTGNGIFYMSGTRDKGKSFLNRKDTRYDDVPYQKVQTFVYGPYTFPFGCR
ncbi:trypsin-like serine peptidase [Pokkaliibacter sp. CJK22405]|uniref:trypsin-like serine peptidase n=1 Tax=Pokkaliibacter sp. CJK22405 TaxID=3384615 RepID=UPI0039854E7D